jgi:hypothetical protein
LSAAAFAGVAGWGVSGAFGSSAINQSINQSINKSQINQ